MTLDQKKLESLLQQNKSIDKVIAFFKKASEKDRQSVAKYCETWYRQQVKAQRGKGVIQEGNSFRLYFHPLLPSAVAAAMSCCAYSVFKSVPWEGRLSVEQVDQIIRDRKPAWASAWVSERFRIGYVSEWKVLRKLIADGLCEKPDHDDYIRTMVDGSGRKKPKTSHGYGTQKSELILAEIAKDPELLESDFWRLFEVPMRMRHSSLFGYADQPWIDAIVALANKKKLARDRLFQAILAAPQMGFNQAQIKFFLELHDRLEPSDKEQVQMRDAYVGLLHSPLAPVVKWSVQTLQEMDQRRPLPWESLKDVIDVLLQSSIKAQFLTGLQWLDKVADRGQASASELAIVATGGLRQSKADLQNKVWQWIAGTPSPSAALIEAVEDQLGSLSVTVRKTAKAWLNEVRKHRVGSEVKSAAVEAESVDSSSALKVVLASVRKQSQRWRELHAIDSLLQNHKDGRVAIPATHFRGTEFRRLDDAQRILPIDEIDPLLETAAQVIEGAAVVEDGERVLEALTRLPCSESARGLAPLKKRLKARLKRRYEPWLCGAGYGMDLVPLILAWAGDLDWSLWDKEIKESHYRPAGLVGCLSVRNQQLLDRWRAGKPAILIGHATHRHGWLDPQELVRRVRALKDDDALLPQDQLLALLRLAPDGREKALRQLEKTNRKSPFIDALRYALGRDLKRGVLQIGKDGPLWIAAARARAPFDDDRAVEKRFPDLGPDAGRAAGYDIQFRESKSQYYDYDVTYYAEDSPSIERIHYWEEDETEHRMELPSVTAHVFGAYSVIGPMDTKPEPGAMADLAATVYPINLAGMYVGRYSVNEDLGPLFDPCVGWDQPQAYALMTSLSSEYAGEVATAIDLAIQVIQDGRYDVDLAGRFLAAEIRQVQRFAKSMSQVAEVSELHQLLMAQTVLIAMEHPMRKVPGRIGDLLVLLSEWVQGLGYDIPEAQRKALIAKVSGSGKAAKLARQIAEYHPEDALDFGAIVVQALEGRLGAGRECLS